jgi:hypothetical protein
MLIEKIKSKNKKKEKEKQGTKMKSIYLQKELNGGLIQWTGH